MKAVINDGGPAFPRPVSFSKEGGTHRGTLGMSLRDYFAGQALNTITTQDDFNTADMAQRAYYIADAMLAARKEAYT